MHLLPHQEPCACSSGDCVELSAEAHCREQWEAPTWIRGIEMERPERLCMEEERKVLGFGRELALEKEVGL